MKQAMLNFLGWLNWTGKRPPIGAGSVSRPSEERSDSSSFAVAGGSPAPGYFVACVLTKNVASGVSIQLLTGRWDGNSEAEAIGLAVQHAMIECPEYQIAMSRALAAQENKNDVPTLAAGTEHHSTTPKL